MNKSEIQIFLAHAHEDQEAVLKLYDRLKKAGYKPWLDKKDLIPGQNWRSVIPQVIADSQLFIACLSQRSIAKRGYVQQEFRIALNQMASFPPDYIYLIPIRLDECEIPNLRQEEYGINLRDIHWLDYWEADGFANLERAIAFQYGSFTQNPQDLSAFQYGSFAQDPQDQHQNFTQDLGNGINLEMIAIPGGSFMMGSPEGEGHNDEKPRHKVTVPSFYMGKYPITQAQYQQVIGNNPSDFQGDNRPVEQVSWNDAVEFCQSLSRQTGTEFRLPTEAEWEYACRAGTTTSYHFGEIINDQLANYGVNIAETTPVGQFSPNAFGLHDMHGNVWEWCQDDWHDNYEGAPTDGQAWLAGKGIKKVTRGGSWISNPFYCRSAIRGDDSPDFRDFGIGFRVVCVSPLQ
ncbi:MAG: SUMF1/EgtB/PvdO family nonheme iron enzyme [Cyanobacteria bacterium P01_G01_bin.39]